MSNRKIGTTAIEQFLKKIFFLIFKERERKRDRNINVCTLTGVVVF